MIMSNLTFDLKKPIYAKDKEEGRVYLVDAVFFPLGKVSGKDISIFNKGEDYYEWRSIEEVELFQK